MLVNVPLTPHFLLASMSITTPQFRAHLTIDEGEFSVNHKLFTNFYINGPLSWLQLCGNSDANELARRLKTFSSTSSIFPSNFSVTLTSDVYAPDQSTVKRGKASPLLAAQYHYHIQKSAGKFSASLDEDDDSFVFKLDSGIWQKEVLAVAMSDLQKLNALSANDLVRFIPCLCDPRFTKVFASKLAQFDYPEMTRIANNLVVLCFEKRPEDALRIAKEFAINKVSEHLEPLTRLKQECDSYRRHLEKVIIDEFNKLKKEYKKNSKEFIEIGALLSKPYDVNAMVAYFDLNKMAFPKNSKARQWLDVATVKFKSLNKLSKGCFSTVLRQNDHRLGMFTNCFLEIIPVLLASPDSRDEKFIKRIKIILSASAIVLLPLVGAAVVAALAIHSKMTVGSARFWMPPSEKFNIKSKRISPDIEVQQVKVRDRKKW